MSAFEAERLLVEGGFAGVQVQVSGHAGEIAALQVPDFLWERMLGSAGKRVADEIRALGFRYVALDLASE